MDFTSIIEYTGNLRTEAVHVKSNSKLITDAPTDNNGKGEAFSPTDLLATSLVSCMITIMGISANNHNIKLGAINAEMTKHMVSNPRRVEQIDINLQVHGTYSEKQKEILKLAAINCPVAKSLHPDIKQNLVMKFTQEA